MIVETQIVSLDDAVEDIEDNFRQAVQKWLDQIWVIMEPRILEEDVKRGLKEILDAVVGPNSPIELDSAMSWSWQVGKIEPISGGAAGKCTIYIADTSLKMKSNEGTTRVSLTSPQGKTFHVQTTIVV